MERFLTSLTKVTQLVKGLANLGLTSGSWLQREHSGLDCLLQCLTQTARKQTYTARKDQWRSQNGATYWAN